MWKYGHKFDNGSGLNGRLAPASCRIGLNWARSSKHMDCVLFLCFRHSRFSRSKFARNDYYFNTNPNFLWSRLKWHKIVLYNVFFVDETNAERGLVVSWCLNPEPILYVRRAPAVNPKVPLLHKNKMIKKIVRTTKEITKDEKGSWGFHFGR